MVMKICPRCYERFSWTPNMGPDYMHQCPTHTGSALRLESVLKVGNWTDYTGTGSVANPHLQGKASKAGGKRVGIDNIDSVNLHGKKKNLYRLRQHLEYIEVE